MFFKAIQSVDIRVNWLKNEVLVSVRLKTLIGLKGIKSTPFYLARILVNITALNLTR